MGWVFPSDVRGWLSGEEGRRLASLAAGKRVLEIGSYCGLSAVCMAQTAVSVDCLDPFDGRGTSEPGDTLPEFLANTARYGVGDKVRPLKGTTAELAPNLAGEYELVFIDGAHDYASVRADIEAAERLLAPGGVIAFHDYRRPADPGVTFAVDEYLAGGADLLDLTGTVATVRPPRKLPGGAARVPRKVSRPKPVVCLSMPTYDGKVTTGAAQAFDLLATRGACEIVRARSNSSFLTKTFNSLWCAGLNMRAQGVTHFAMQHADIMPAHHGWLDTLLEELVRHDADVVSAVSPIKNANGLTSTAVALDLGDPWLCRRLTMAEVYQLPETFGAEHVGGPLLVNTGLWVARLDRPWCEEVCFDVLNRMVRVDGEWHAEAIPEDWLFSQHLNRKGARVLATRKVVLGHEGTAEYTTDRVWGTQTTDEVFHKVYAKRGSDASQVHAGVQGETGRPGVQGGAGGGVVGAERQPLHQPGGGGACAG